MPGKIKVKVLAGRNLPVMDRASDTTDAFVEIKFGGVTHKTDVCRKSLNPHWSSTEWYRFEVDESELQDEPLQLRLMDHDTYSANDAIGKVVISLAPLLAREANNAKGTTGPPGGAVLSGWIPVFDTMHGIRGELNVIVKVELFSDFNKYKTSSCGVQFFHCPMIPPGYKATSIHGFVEELVVNDDPEYQWIDKIRTPRASNEARQVAFIKLSNQVQRLVGLKAAELGANAVVGYQQEFDLEGEAGVVARAIGTAVSITALPTPCQPVNTIPCTQQQLKKCLDILVTDDDSITDLSQYYQTHREELQKMIQILNPKGLSLMDSQENDDDDDRVELVRQSSLNSYAGSASLYQDNYLSRNSLRHLSEDQTDLNRLLNRNDDDSDSSGPIQKIKKLKTNFFTKRFTKRKGEKKSDNKQDDTMSIKSNSSDTSRISFYDIKNELSKFKRIKKPKFRKSDNKEDEGEGMASILARSVIHARTSLQAIAETQDSQAENSPCSTLRRVSESNPNLTSDDDKVRNSIQKDKEVEDKSVPEIQFSSLKNISTEDAPREPRVRRISESCPTSPVSGRTDNLLKLPGETGYFGSVSSALSGESSIYSTSEDEEESSDLRTDTDEAFETTSSVVKSVIRQEAEPDFIDEMDRKLTVLLNTPPKLDESLIDNYEKRVSKSPDDNKREANKPVEKETSEFECKIEKAEANENIETPVSSESTKPSGEKCVSKHNSHYIKLHNPFAHKKTSVSISCPSSPVEKHSKHNFVYRSSKRIKDKLAKISKSNMIKSISHISLFPKKKEQTLSQPGSSSDVPSCPSKCPSETVLGSHFLSYSDLLGLDNDRIQASKLCKSDEIGRSKFSMYIGSEPVSRCSLSGPSHPHSRDEHDHKRERHSLKPAGLVKTAMETMLIEKVEALLIPTSPDPVVNTKFFDDVSEKLEEHKNSGANMRELQSTTASTTPRIVAVTPKRLSQDLNAKVDKLIEKKLEKEHKRFELKDYPQVILPKQERKRTISLHEELDDDAEKHRKKEARGSFSTLLDKVHFHPHFFHHKKDGSSHNIKSGGLIQAAMQTILIDRAQSMIPDTPEPIPIHTEPDFGEIGKHEKEHSHKDKDSKGLVHSALQTMLIDNVQSVLPDVKEPVPINTEPDFGEDRHKSLVKEEESKGLIHSALQTMLIDNVQSVLSDSSEPIPIRIEAIPDDTKSQKSHGSEKESTGLVHSALQTMLIDNVQSVLSDSAEPIPIRIETNSDDNKSQKSHGSEKDSTGLVHSALQTMLIDNVQSVLPDMNDPIPIRFDPYLDDTKSQNSHVSDKESTGLVHSALQTMLIDNVQSVLPASTEPVPIRLDQNADDTKSQKSHEFDKECTGFVQTALETMLIENVHSILPDSSNVIPTQLDSDKEKTTSADIKPISNLTHTAVDKVQAVLKPNTVNVEGVAEKCTDHEVPSDKDEKAFHSTMENILIDRMQTIFPNGVDTSLNKETVITPILCDGFQLKSTELVKNAMEKIEKAQSSFGSTDNLEISVGDAKSHEAMVELFSTATKSVASDNFQTATETKDLKNLENTSVAKKSKVALAKSNKESINDKSWSEDKEDLTDIKKDQPRKPTKKKIRKQKQSFEERKTHFTRQDSIHSVTSTKMSNAKVTTSGSETTPSVDNDDRIDGAITNVNKPSGSDGANQASVCDNLHAACRFDREPRDRDKDRSEKGSPRHARHESYGGKEPGGEKAHNSSLNASSTPMGIHRRSSDSDLSVTPKGGSLNTSASNVGSGGGAILRPSMNSNNIDMLEYPFLTMTEYPPGFIVHIGGAVCARSVKLVDGGGESAARAAWWAELRTELRAHARALRCNAVIAYRDTAHICEDVCVLSASGTAVVINLDCDYSADIDLPSTVNGTKTPEEIDTEACSIAHVPYSPGAGPYRAELSVCGGCRRARVPAVLLAACAKPNRLTAYPKAVTLTAVAARIRRAQPSSEPGARDISDQLPFLEYELHKLLLAKLRMQGANALFSLQTQIAIGERCVMALASGTAVKLTALPPPTPPRIKGSEKEKDALEIQKALWDTFTANKAINGYDVPMVSENPTNNVLPESEGEVPTLDLCSDKDACVLELDEAEDVETARALAKRRVNMQAYTSSLTQANDAQPLAFTQVSRARLVLSSGSACGSGAARATARALDAAAYKLRRLAPTALHANFQLDLPEDEIQLVVSGTAIPLADPPKPDASEPCSRSQSHSQGSSQNSQSSTADDDIFQLDEEQRVPQEIVEEKSALNGQVGSAVTLSTLSSVGRGRCARRLCALRLLFVRETTAVRELGGLSGFLHTFTCEVLAILRAYTAALGGNALTSFYITQLMLQDNAHKNQGQCLLSVGGDVVHVSY